MVGVDCEERQGVEAARPSGRADGDQAIQGSAGAQDGMTIDRLRIINPFRASER